MAYSGKRSGVDGKYDRYAIVGHTVRLLDALGSWRTLYELGADLELSPRTVRRLIYAVEAAGIRVKRRKRAQYVEYQWQGDG
jgi:DNA-binding transcriptional ArsR family regulator